jgi:hypothetical protein
MDDNLHFHKFSLLDNMMANILAEGEDKVWLNLESIKDPLIRIKEKKLYFDALRITKK